jgi:hypothetical protein
MSLLARFTAFLRGEGLLEDEDKAQGDIEPGGGLSSEQHTGVSQPNTSPGEQTPTGPSSSLLFSSTPEYRQMSTELNEQAAIIAELKADFVREYDKAQYVDNVRELKELVRLGKMTAGECEQWRDVAAEHPAAFAAVLGTLKARPVLPQFNDRSTRRIAPDPEEPAGRLIALSKERSARTGERYDAAFSRVCRENPELAAAHAATAPSYGGGE